MLVRSLKQASRRYKAWHIWRGECHTRNMEEMESSPAFLGSPCGSVPRARDSGGSSQPRDSGSLDTAFRQANGVGIRNDETLSELNPHGPLPHCLRFAPTSHPVNGKTRFRPARYGVDRAGLSPAGLQ